MLGSTPLRSNGWTTMRLLLLLLEALPLFALGAAGFSLLGWKRRVFNSKSKVAKLSGSAVRKSASTLSDAAERVEKIVSAGGGLPKKTQARLREIAAGCRELQRLGELAQDASKALDAPEAEAREAVRIAGSLCPETLLKWAGAASAGREADETLDAGVSVLQARMAELLASAAERNLSRLRANASFLRSKYPDAGSDR